MLSLACQKFSLKVRKVSINLILTSFQPLFIIQSLRFEKKICYTNGFLLMLEATTNRITIYLAYSKFEPLLIYFVGL